MATSRTNSTVRMAPGAGRWMAVPRGAEAAGYLFLAAIVGWWAWRAFHDSRVWDTGLAYSAGQVLWSTGHPEHVWTWNGMPFLAATMALIGRVLSARGTADVITALDLLLPLSVIVVALRRLRGRIPAWGWWVAAVGLVAFPPLMSSMWWKQFNSIALVLAVAGFELARRRRPGWAALSIALSVSVKPLAILLPLVLVARRDSRRVGLTSILWIAGLDLAAQALYAIRGHDIALLNPYPGIHNIVHRTTAAGNIWLCHPLNFSPTSLFCRLNGGFGHWTLQRVAVYGAVALLGLWVIRALRGRGALDWEVLGFTCVLSVMLGAIGWSHYQVMLAPLFLLLLVRFSSDGADLVDWIGLAVAYALAALMLEPYGTIYTQLAGINENPIKPTFLEEYAQFAQYVLVLTGIIWYSRRAVAVPPRGAGAGSLR